MFNRQNIFGRGKENKVFAEYFVGSSYLNPLTKPGKDPVFIANITFEPGCRNNWHIHRGEQGGEQILICTAGSGWYQEEGKEPLSLTPGMVVTIPVNVKHWHGAKRDAWFSHLAFNVPGVATDTEWCEPVSSGLYNSL
jgi:quercetin dioxygenase-like cupin family protein